MFFPYMICDISIYTEQRKPEEQVERLVKAVLTLCSSLILKNIYMLYFHLAEEAEISDCIRPVLEERSRLCQLE